MVSTKNSFPIVGQTILMVVKKLLIQGVWSQIAISVSSWTWDPSPTLKSETTGEGVSQLCSKTLWWQWDHCLAHRSVSKLMSAGKNTESVLSGERFHWFSENISKVHSWCFSPKLLNHLKGSIQIPKLGIQLLTISLQNTGLILFNNN